MKANFGVDSMPETAENVAMEFKVSREDQDAFALQSQQRTAQAQMRGFLAEEIISVSVPQRRGDPTIVEQDEHPRSNTQLEQLSILRPIVKADGTVTAGNASGVNDGAAALLLASNVAVKQYGLTPIVKIITTTTAGVEPRIMGFGPAPAVQKLLAKTRLTIDKISVFEINEAFAAQVLAVNRNLGLADNDERVNPNGGAIALGHPLGASGARLIMSAAHQLRRSGQRYAICALCIGVGQGMAMLLENADYSG
jgi:acetyl-CoA acetyltransferase family protein